MNRVIAASSIVVVVAFATAFSAGPGMASSGVPAGLVGAIHAQLGAGSVSMSSVGGSPPPQAYMGYTVSLSADGTTALVGAPGAVGGGAAYIFHVSDAGSWSSSSVPAATLTNGSGHFYDFIAYQVALSADGTTAFIGDPCCSDAAAVLVYRAPSEDAWASSSSPDAVLSVTHGYGVGYAFAVTPDGTTLLVGDLYFNNYAGGGYVFHVASEGDWVTTSTPDAVLSNINEPDDDYFVGLSVAISDDGTTALLSDSETGNELGGAYIYRAPSADAWTSTVSPTAIISDSNSAENDALGTSVALSGSGTTAVLGAPGGYYADPGFAGYADVFHTSDEGSWASTSTPTATLSDDGGFPDDQQHFGNSVAVSQDGATALLSVPGANALAGAVDVFHVANETSWASSTVPTATLTDSTGAAHDLLGLSVAFSADGGTALVGAPGVDQFTGDADVFHVSDASSWATTSAPTATLTNAALLDQLCLVPTLKKLTLPKAKAALTAAHCVAGKVTNTYSATIKYGHVVSQSPAPGTHLGKGSKVNFKLSIGPFHR